AVQVSRLETSSGERLAARLVREIGRRLLPGNDEAAFGDSAALADPGVARVHELREVVVRNSALGDIHAGPRNSCSAHGRHLLPPSAASAREPRGASGSSLSQRVSATRSRRASRPMLWSAETGTAR